MMNMRHAIWRNRATAILGGLVFLLALFSGFPGMIDRVLYLILGLAVMIIGFAGSRARGANTTVISNTESAQPIKDLADDTFSDQA